MLYLMCQCQWRGRDIRAMLKDSKSKYMFSTKENGYQLVMSAREGETRCGDPNICHA